MQVDVSQPRHRLFLSRLLPECASGWSCAGSACLDLVEDRALIRCNVREEKSFGVMFFTLGEVMDIRTACGRKVLLALLGTQMMVVVAMMFVETSAGKRCQSGNESSFVSVNAQRVLERSITTLNRRQSEND